MLANARKAKVFLLCSGLGRVNRGFESFTRELFDAISVDPRLDLFLFKGAGTQSSREKAVGWLHRDQPSIRWLCRAFKRDGYYLEQADFIRGLIPYLVWQKPDVIYFSDGMVGNFLYRLRPILKLRYRMVFSNGGPLSPDYYKRFDHVHQVTRPVYDSAANAGLTSSQQTLIPYGFKIPATFSPMKSTERSELKLKLGLDDRPIILAVGAINRSHKRMDHVVREVAQLPTPRPLLVLLGQTDAETSDLLVEAKQLLGSDIIHRQVPAETVSSYYQIANLFVLSSFSEGFGRVFIEALSNGTRCVVHDGEVQRDVLGEFGDYVDMASRGVLSSTLRRILEETESDTNRQTRHEYAKKNFSWYSVANDYVSMLFRAATP